MPRAVKINSGLVGSASNLERNHEMCTSTTRVSIL